MRNFEKTFELEWKLYGNSERIYGHTEQMAKEYLFKQFGHGLTEEWFKGKRILDAGCGHGNLVKIFADMGAETVGVDLNEEVCKISKEKVKHLPNAKIVHHDLLDSLSALGEFDFVFSSGVIHHTPNARKAFKNLAKATKKGGYLGVWVYPKGSWLWENSNKFVRFFTTKLPKKMLYYLCYIPVPMMYFVPVYSRTHPSRNTWKECAQCAYDWLAPKYQSHHTYEELKSWYGEEGFHDIKPAPIATGAVGRKLRVK